MADCELDSVADAPSLTFSVVLLELTFVLSVVDEPEIKKGSRLEVLLPDVLVSFEASLIFSVEVLIEPVSELVLEFVEEEAVAAAVELEVELVSEVLATIV